MKCFVNKSGNIRTNDDISGNKIQKVNCSVTFYECGFYSYRSMSHAIILYIIYRKHLISICSLHLRFQQHYFYRNSEQEVKSIFA